MAGMGEKIIWLAGAALVYILFCLYCAWRGAKSGAKKENVSALALSGAGLTGWLFVSHIGLVYRDGLPYASVALACITLPLLGLIFFERLVAVSREHDTRSLPQLLGVHFESGLIRILAAVIGLVFAIIILAALTRAGGALVNLLSDDVISTQHAMIGLTLLLLLYAGAGGLSGTLRMARVQYLLFILTLVLCSIITIYYLGSFERLQFGLSELGRLDEAPGPSGLSKYLSSPGILQSFSSSREAIGSPWTGVLTLTTLIAMLGVLTSPVFAGWILASTDPAKLARRQIWTTGLVLGAAVILGATLIGLGGHILGANMLMTDNSDDAVYNVMGANLGGMDLMETFGQQEELVPILIALTADTLPWLFGLLAVCAIAAMQCTAGAMLQGGASIAANDLLPAREQRGRLASLPAALVIALLALLLAWGEENTISQHGSFALALSVQLLPAIAALCFALRFSASGIIAGQAAGTVAVVLTEEASTALLGFSLWGGWPLTIHSAAWGLAANFGATLAVSLATRRPVPDEPATTTSFSPALWALAAVWLVVGAGPGMVFGSTVFGHPNDRATWLFGIPSLWAWLILFWILGLFLLLIFARRPSQASQT